MRDAEYRPIIHEEAKLKWKDNTLESVCPAAFQRIGVDGCCNHIWMMMIHVQIMRAHQRNSNMCVLDVSIRLSAWLVRGERGLGGWFLCCRRHIEKAKKNRDWNLMCDILATGREALSFSINNVLPQWLISLNCVHACADVAGKQDMWLWVAVFLYSHLIHIEIS